MSREVTVGAPITTTYTAYDVLIKCDKCGGVIHAEEPPNDDEDLYAQELVILLNPNLCVNSRIKYDFCRPCLEPIWFRICDALGIDPDDEHRIGDDDV